MGEISALLPMYTCRLPWQSYMTHRIGNVMCSFDIYLLGSTQRKKREQEQTEYLFEVLPVRLKLLALDADCADKHVVTHN